MRRAPKTPLVAGTLYRNVALLAVGLAVLMALFSGGGGQGGDPAIRLPVSKAPERAAMAESSSAAPARFDDSVEPVEPAQPSAPTAASPGEPPPLPDGTTLPGARAPKADPARPTPAQLRHLVEQSRMRSGANPGGD